MVAYPFSLLQIGTPLQTQSAVGLWITGIGLIVSLIILIISLWNLYLSHYKEHRSDVTLLMQESKVEKASFAAGNQALNEKAEWFGTVYLKITNAGEKGAHISSTSHKVIGFRKEDDFTDATGITTKERNGRLPTGTEIDPHTTVSYIPRITISPPEDVRIFIEHDAVVIQHEVVIEDNKGSYKVTHESEAQLIGPEPVREKFEEEKSSP